MFVIARQIRAAVKVPVFLVTLKWIPSWRKWRLKRHGQIVKREPAESRKIPRLELLVSLILVQRGVFAKAFILVRERQRLFVHSLHENLGGDPSVLVDTALPVHMAQERVLSDKRT